MRYLLGTLLLASCTMFTPLPVDEQPAEPSVPVTEPSTPVVQRERPEKKRPAPRQKPIVPAPNAPATEIASCVSLDAGDLKETIKAKLDCITENTR
jgi:hypothetical protein